MFWGSCYKDHKWIFKLVSCCENCEKTLVNSVTGHVVKCLIKIAWVVTESYSTPCSCLCNIKIQPKCLDCWPTLINYHEDNETLNCSRNLKKKKNDSKSMSFWMKYWRSWIKTSCNAWIIMIQTWRLITWANKT